MAEWDASLVLLGLSGSRLIEAGRAAGLTVMQEVFADRRYQSDGQLVSRETPGALITDPEVAAEQAYALAQGQTVVALDGSPLLLAADTLCLHSDTPGAIGLARAVAQRGLCARYDVQWRGLMGKGRSNAQHARRGGGIAKRQLIAGV